MFVALSGLSTFIMAFEEFASLAMTFQSNLMS